MSCDRTHRESGFSVIELATALSLTLIVMVSGYTLYEALARRNADEAQRVQLQSDVRLALDGMVRELRQATSGDPDTPAIEAMSPTSFTFVSPDRSTPFRARRIVYRIDADRLDRSIALSTNAGEPPWTYGSATPFVPVLHQVHTGSSFEFVDAAGVPTSDPAAVRMVVITLIVDATSSNRAPGPQTYTQTVEIRSV